MDLLSAQATRFRSRSYHIRCRCVALLQHPCLVLQPRVETPAVVQNRRPGLASGARLGLARTCVLRSERRTVGLYLWSWSHPPGSNRRPADYESAALPTELGWLVFILISLRAMPAESWIQLALPGSAPGFNFSRWSSDSTATRTLSGTRPTAIPKYAPTGSIIQRIYDSPH